MRTELFETEACLVSRSRTSMLLLLLCGLRVTHSLKTVDQMEKQKICWALLRPIAWISHAFLKRWTNCAELDCDISTGGIIVQIYATINAPYGLFISTIVFKQTPNDCTKQRRQTQICSMNLNYVEWIKGEPRTFFMQKVKCWPNLSTYPRNTIDFLLLIRLYCCCVNRYFLFPGDSHLQSTFSEKKLQLLMFDEDTSILIKIHATQISTGNTAQSMVRAKVVRSLFFQFRTKKRVCICNCVALTLFFSSSVPLCPTEPVRWTFNNSTAWIQNDE